MASTFTRRRNNKVPQESLAQNDNGGAEENPRTGVQQQPMETIPESSAKNPMLSSSSGQRTSFAGLRWYDFVVALVLGGLPLAGGFLSSKYGNSGAYGRNEYSKPAWAPPPKVFPVTWSLHYICMGVACVVAYGSHARRRRSSSGASNRIPLVCWLRAGLFFLGQLALFYAFTPLFFGSLRFSQALLTIGLAAGMLLGLVGMTFDISVAAALLLTPCLGWACFLAALNHSILDLNQCRNLTNSTGGSY